MVVSPHDRGAWAVTSQLWLCLARAAGKAGAFPAGKSAMPPGLGDDRRIRSRSVGPGEPDTRSLTSHHATMSRPWSLQSRRSIAAIWASVVAGWLGVLCCLRRAGLAVCGLCPIRPLCPVRQPSPDEVVAGLRAANARLRELLAERDAQIAELRVQVAQLEELREQVVAELQAQVADLAARVKQNSKNSSKPPSSDGLGKPAPKSLRKKTGRRPGRPKGQPGATMS